MSKSINLQTLVHTIGPAMADISQEADANDTFVQENYDVLKKNNVFSALVPEALGGGGGQAFGNVRIHSYPCNLLSFYCPGAFYAPASDSSRGF